MAKTKTKQAAGGSELKNRLIFLFLAILVYRIGTFVTIPGVDPAKIQQLIDSASEGAQSILGLGNLFSGGAITRMSIFSLGLMPYISASIVMQLLSHMPGKLKDLRTTGGSSGRKKITQYTRYLALLVAFVQGSAVCFGLQAYAVYQGPAFWVVGGFCFATGAIFLMWLGEQITDRGIGNGISMLIFAGICASLPNILGGLISGARTGDVSSPVALGIFVLLIALFFLIVYVERTQRRIPIHYARQQAVQFGGRQNYLPLKINLAGVIAAIFASAIIILLSTVFGIFSNNILGDMFGGTIGRYANQIATSLQSGQPFYVIVYGFLIIGFSFFYTGLVFENKDLANDLKKSSAFIQGIRPGKATADYIDLVQNRLTLVGAVYVAFVVLIPEVFNMNKGNTVLLQFGGTSLLIIVVVAMDFITQVQSHLMSKQYASLMKSSHIGRRRTR